MLSKLIRRGRQFFVLTYLKLIYRNRFSYNQLRIMAHFKVYVGENGKIRINQAYFNNGCSVNCMNSIIIGRNCLFGENVKLYDHNHIFKDINIPISEQGYTSSPIVIGNNCWIGSNVTILKGVSIGDNVVIGANCLIYRDVPSNSIVKAKSEVIVINRN